MPLAPPIDAIQQPAVGIYGLPVGASAGVMVLLTAAQIRAIADLSGYVPYTGATGAVDLGANALTVGAITASGQITTGSAVAGQTYGIQVGNGVAASSDFSYLRFPTGWGNIDFKSWGGALAIYGSGLSLVTAPRFVVDSTGRFGAASGSAFSASTDATLSRASAGVWQMGTTADNALGSLNLANLTASGTILTRNGTSPTSIQITNTYTSSTSFGLLDIRANAAQTAYEISSFLGSAGGAALPINIGHRDSAGTFTSALEIRTDLDVRMPTGLRCGTLRDINGVRHMVLGGSFVQTDVEVYQLNPIYHAAKSTVTIPNGYGSIWVASASGTKDGIAYAVGDVLITTVTSSVSKTVLLVDYSAI